MAVRLRDLIIGADPEPVLFLCALIATLFGITLLLPGPTFAIETSQTTVIGLLIKEELFGSIMLLFGVLGLAGSLSGWRWLMRTGCLAYVGLFAFRGATFVLADYHSTGNAYIILALGAAWAFLRLIPRNESNG